MAVPSAESTAEHPRETWGQVLAERRWAIFLVICGGIWLHAADSLIVATVMPIVVEELGGVAWTGWALTLYIMASIVAGALSGMVAARRGAGLALGTSGAVFAAGCVVSGLAMTMGVFLLGRAIQGFGGGAMMALCHIAITRAFPERHWTRIIAAVSGVWGASSLVGPLLGGLFAEAGHWRGAFLAFAAQALVVAAAAPLLLRRSAAAARVVEAGEGVPWRALALLTPGVLAVALAGVLANPLWAVLAALAGLACVVLFVLVDRHEHRSGRPGLALLPHRSLGRAPVRDGLAMVLLFCISSVSFAVYGPLLLARLHGLGPLATGYVVSVESLAWTLVAMAVGRVRPKDEPFCLRLGSLIIVGGTAAFGLLMPQGPVWGVALAAALQGGGFGLCWAFIVRRIVVAAPTADRDRAAGAVTTLQMLGYALGAALAGIVANGLGFTMEGPLAVAESVGEWIFLAFVPLGLGGVLAAWRLAR